MAEKEGFTKLNTFFTADLHMDHRNIVLHCLRWPWMFRNPDYDPNRPNHIKLNWPWSVRLEEHNQAFADNWNSMVSRGDRVYVLGDFAFMNHMRHLMRLNGKKILITGNHDKMNQECLRNFTEVHEWGCMRNVGLGVKDDRGREKSVYMALSHCAMMVWPSSIHGSWHLYGHSHGRLPEWGNKLAFDVGVDVWGYQPVPLEAVVAKMTAKIDALRANNRSAGDGESSMVNKTQGDANERVLSIRRGNFEVLKSLGIAVKYDCEPKEGVPDDPGDGAEDLD
jgi:calcineurin-like phosphoesterase family protein